MANDRPPLCVAKRYSDQMMCICGNTWDMNDPSPPDCQQSTPGASAAQFAAMHGYSVNALRESAARNASLYEHSEIAPQLLERFANPSTGKGAAMWEHIHAPEFTCLCPITSQPDYAHIDLYYYPDEWCIESKSLKLYLMSYRNVGTFHEAACVCMCDDLSKLLAPSWLLIIGRFAPRGGIAFQPRAWCGAPPRELLWEHR
jgi:7-cyano-7-deazaguanine reductase